MVNGVSASIHCFASPSAIYRYRPLATAKSLKLELEALREGYVYCSSYGDLNDPMEGRHRLSALFKQSPNKEEVLRLIGQYGVTAFSETHTSETMWAYYANQFKGICLKYSVRKLLAGLPSGAVLSKMNYNELPPMFLRNRQASSLKAKMALSYKTIRWAHEREWRLINDCVGKAHYEDTSAVSDIYFGARVNDAVRAAVLNAANDLNIKCYDMKVNSYSLDFIRTEAFRPKLKRIRLDK
ncbi:DUF2971 domain-containing protein [Cereibacter sphaeroides]|nr:DUF2971 domain-containing protein [Cereibacter sphaeroides]